MDERKVERVEVDGMELRVEAVDQEEEAETGIHTALPPRIESWRRRSVTGAVLSGFAFGLREVLEPEREETAIIVQVSGEPVGDLPVEAHLKEGPDGESVVTVRPWLLQPSDQPSDQAAGAAPAAAAAPAANGEATAPVGPDDDGPRPEPPPTAGSTPAP